MVYPIGSRWVWEGFLKLIPAVLVDEDGTIHWFMV